MKLVPSSDRKDGCHPGRSMLGQGHQLYQLIDHGNHSDEVFLHYSRNLMIPVSERVSQRTSVATV